MILVLWYSASSILSRFIRRVTRSPYSHVALMLLDPDTGEGTLYEALGRGVVQRDGADALTRAAEAVATARLKVSATDEQQTRAWLWAQVGRSYSLTGFVTSGLTSIGIPAPVVALNGQFVCSGLVATALQVAGLFNPRLDPRLETPGSLAVRLDAVRCDGSTGV